MAGASGTVLNRDDLARRYAQRHLEIDEAVKQILFLPAGAPAQEIRLLEVNDMISETMPLEPIDFGVNIGGADAHTLYVLDVTPSQWESIQSDPLLLPAGWTLDGSQVLGRR